MPGSRDDSGFMVVVTQKLLGTKDQKELTNVYNELGARFEEGVRTVSYEGPIATAEIVRRYVTDDKATFLDVGAGTGIQAEELRKVGFSGDFDGLDPSEELAKEAMRRGRYRQFFHEYITETEECSIKTGTYDNIVSMGAFIPHHIKYQTITELLRIVKTGGYVFICIRKNYLETEHYQGYQQFVDKLQKEGICEYTAIDIPFYYVDYPGLVLVFKKTQ
ncbi:methyltransferase-like protein 27 [Tubulanus polymorphus]|uniref:methyltransferase-like protein 27 n=1 Tax=Tubulanus polymorphus TaxID=672921 RepID=UPI003DA635A7